MSAPGPRIAVRALLLDAGAILLARSYDRYAPDRLWWELPGGGVDPGESRDEALRRELREETGYVDVEIGTEVVWWETTWVFTDREVHQRDHVHVVTLRSGERVEPSPLATEGLHSVSWVDVDRLARLEGPIVPPSPMDVVRLAGSLGSADPVRLEVGDHVPWPPP